MPFLCFMANLLILKVIGYLLESPLSILYAKHSIADK